MDSKGNIVKEEVAFEYEKDGVKITLEVVEELYNLNKVVDFDNEVVDAEDTTDLLALFIDVNDSDVTSAQILKHLMVNAANVPESAVYKNHIDVEFTSPDMGEMAGSLDIAFKYLNQKFEMEATGAAMGIEVSGEVWGNEKEIVLHSDFLQNIPEANGATYVVMDLEELQEEQMSMLDDMPIDTDEDFAFTYTGIDVSEDDIEEVRAALGLMVNIGTYVVYDFDITNILDLSEPTKETVSIEGEDVAATKIEIKITLDKLEDMYNDILGYAKDNEGLFEAINVLQGGGMSFEEYNLMVAEFEGNYEMIMGEAEMYVEMAKPYVDALDMVIYVNEDGKTVKSELLVDYSDDFFAVMVEGQATVSEIDAVEDFELKEADPDKTMPFEDFMMLIEDAYYGSMY